MKQHSSSGDEQSNVLVTDPVHSPIGTHWPSLLSHSAKPVANLPVPSRKMNKSITIATNATAAAITIHITYSDPALFTICFIIYRADYSTAYDQIQPDSDSHDSLASLNSLHRSISSLKADRAASFASSELEPSYSLIKLFSKASPGLHLP